MPLVWKRAVRRSVIVAVGGLLLAAQSAVAQLQITITKGHDGDR